MEWLRALARLTFVLCVLAFLLTIGDFLALHDISRDYVSSQVLRSLNTSLAENLPAWTGTGLEWTVVRVSFIFRAGFLLVNAVTLAFLARALKSRGAAA
jgi:hypothetical protein